MVEDNMPVPGLYRHTETDDLVEYLNRDDNKYYFSINGNRILKLNIEDWNDYKQFLIRE